MSLRTQEQMQHLFTEMAETSDTTWECKHGRMWWDKTPACGCWGEMEGKPHPILKSATQDGHNDGRA